MNKNRIIAETLTVALVLGNIGMTNIYAADGKEEVVYVNTESDGKVDDVNVVNIFEKGNITDYGNYTSVKMLNTTESISQNGDKITFSTDKDKVYYQGTLENVQIPWNIKITYKLDGKEIKPEELAGKSGKLNININIEKNSKAEGDFYDNYALQASLSLDTEKCENIVADGATMANVGANKQISYTVLPGKGLAADITADVKDFEMDAIAINGVKLSLNIDIDDKELMDKVQEIMDASKEISNGASRVSDGTDDLKDGGNTLSKGAVSLNKGAKSLNSGIDTLDTGVKSMDKALGKLNKSSKSITGGSAKMLKALKEIQKELNSVSVSSKQLKELTKKSAEIKKGINDAYKGAVELESSLSYDSYKSALKSNGLDVNELKSGNDNAINSLSAQIKELSDSVNQLKSIPGYENNETYVSQVKQLKSQIGNLQGIITLLQGNNGAINGTEQYFIATGNGASKLVKGLKQLNDNYEKFDAAIVKLADSLSNLTVNISKLKTAINQLVTSYEKLDKGTNNYTDGVASIVTAYSKIVTGTGSLAKGGKELVSGSKYLKQGTADLYTGITSLNSGAKKLNDGTQEFYDKTKGMDTKIENTIDEMLDSLSGTDSDIKSFVSGKNKNVESVQFVIKTSSIEKSEKTTRVTETKEKLNFWEKLLKLFGR